MAELHRGSEVLLPIYQSCVFRSDARVDSHSHVARELADHDLQWKRGIIDAALYKGRLSRLQFYVLRYGAEVDVTPEPFDDFALVHMSLRGAAQIEADGQRVDVAEGRAAIVAPRRALRLHWHQGTEQLILKVPYSLMREVQAEQSEKLEFGSVSLIPRALGSHWELLVRSLLNVLHMPTESGLHPSWLSDLERNVALFLLAHQPQTNPQTAMARSSLALIEADGEMAPTGDSRRMDALLKYVAARLGAPISLFDLAAAAGVSIRTLNELCRRHHGSTPMELLRNMRLDAVHDVLRLNPNASITNTALECGFGHLGRFAASYAERFGELPRQTAKLQPK